MSIGKVNNVAYICDYLISQIDFLNFYSNFQKVIINYHIHMLQCYEFLIFVNVLLCRGENGPSPSWPRPREPPANLEKYPQGRGRCNPLQHCCITISEIYSIVYVVP